MRAQRAGLTPAARKQATRAALHRLTKLRCFRRAQKIALYYPVGGEFDAALLKNSKAMRGKQIYLPVLARGSTPCLKFARWQHDTQWRPNRFGIAEPLTRPATLLRPNELGLVVTPLVGFDAACHRLGAGGGYYDRSFAYKSRGASWRRPLLVGIAFECQRVDLIQTQPWDVSLDAVVTEQHLYLR